MEQTECKKCGRMSDFVDMKNCPFCDPNYKPLTLNTLIENRSNIMDNKEKECKECWRMLAAGCDVCPYCKKPVSNPVDNNKEGVESFPGINSTSQSSMNPEFYAPQSPVSEELLSGNKE